MENRSYPKTIFMPHAVKKMLAMCCYTTQTVNRIVFIHVLLLNSVKHEHSERECGCFCSADGCCVEFRLASCGQDSQLKIWIVSQREVAGRPTPLPASSTENSLTPLPRREGERLLTALTLKSLCRIEKFY